MSNSLKPGDTLKILTTEVFIVLAALQILARQTFYLCTGCTWTGEDETRPPTHGSELNHRGQLNVTSARDEA